MPDFSGTMLSVLLWEVHNSLAIARELCFPKQHYESIVPSNPGINRYIVVNSTLSDMPTDHLHVVS